MPRLLIHVEGQTEEDFVKEVLRDHLVAKGFHSVDARLIGNARQRGGIRKWSSVKKGIVNHLKEDPECTATTIIDYYAMPQKEPDGWPGRASAATLPGTEAKANCVEQAMQADVSKTMGDNFTSSRFVPFVLMHEFEALLFSDCAAFSQAIYHSSLQPAFQEIRSQFATPEDIDDSPATAPSKRIRMLIPGYDKRLLGVLGIIEIGLGRIRAECPHFNAWLNTLEATAHPPFAHPSQTSGNR